MVEISDEMVEATAKALVMERTNGLCDEWPKACADCDCFRDQTEAASAAYDRSHARAVLAAALPLIEAAVRADQAEIIAHLRGTLPAVAVWIDRVDPHPDVNGDQFAELRAIVDSA